MTCWSLTHSPIFDFGNELLIPISRLMQPKGVIKLRFTFETKRKIDKAIQMQLEEIMLDLCPRLRIKADDFKFQDLEFSFVATFKINIRISSVITTIKSITSRKVNDVNFSAKSNFWTESYKYQSVDSSKP